MVSVLALPPSPDRRSLYNSFETRLASVLEGLFLSQALRVTYPGKPNEKGFLGRKDENHITFATILPEAVKDQLRLACGIEN